MDLLSPYFLVLSLVLSSFIVSTESDRVISSADIETLQLAQVLFRHGARSPLSSYKNDPYNNTEFWPDGLGQLTGKGKLMEYELGEYLRWRYTGFVNRTYTAPEVYAQSSDIDRAIMSADLVLAGMFPPTPDSPSSMWASELTPSIMWNPIPVHTIPAHEDNKISFSAKCTRYETIFKEYLASPQMKLLNDQNVDVYTYLTEKSGINITDIMGINELYDVLYIQELHKLKLPDWASRYYPDKLRILSEYLWEAIVGTKEMKRLRMGPLLLEMMSNMEKKSGQNIKGQLDKGEKGGESSPPEAKLYLYSGHDSTVAALLGALGVFERQTPPYSAAVIVELHQEDKLSPHPGRHFIKVFVRNDTTLPPYELKIPKCGSPCTLDEVKQILDDLSITDFNAWTRECQKSSIFSLNRAEEFFQGIEFWASFTFFIMFVVGVIVASIVFTTIILPWHSKKMLLAHNNDDEKSPSSSKAPSRNSISNNNYKV